MPQPTSSVAVCALPRTGSSLLTTLLHSSGVVGWPGEWFWRDDREPLSREWGVPRFEDYLARVLDAGKSANRVFAVKLMWGYLHELLFELRRLAREYDAGDLDVLRRFFREPRFLWLRRETSSRRPSRGRGPLTVPPALTRQADELNSEWAARYRELARL